MGSLRYMSSPTTGKMPYQAGVPPVKKSLKPNQKPVGDTHNIYTTIAHMAMMSGQSLLQLTWFTHK